VIFDRIALAITILGSLNAGLAVFNLNFINSLFGIYSTAAKICYAIIGISAIWCISLLFRHREYEPDPGKI